MKDEEIKRLKEALEQHEEKMRRQAEELKRETQEKVDLFYNNSEVLMTNYQGVMPSHL